MQVAKILHPAQTKYIRFSAWICWFALIFFSPFTHAQDPISPAQAVSVAVEIRGVEDDILRNNIQAWLGFSAAAADKSLDKTRAHNLHAGAVKAITTALEPLGYYHASVLPEWLGDSPNYIARYTVELGEPVRWIAPSVELDNTQSTPAFIGEILRNSPLSSGQIALHADYEKLKTTLISAARNDGYWNANLDRKELIVDPEKNTAQASIKLALGKRYFFGPITFSGNYNLRNDFLNRYIRFHTGEPLSPQKILDTQFAFNDLDYFEQVQISPQTEQMSDDTDAVPVEIKLMRRKNRRDSIGLGYGTDTGMRGSIGTDFRRLNRQGHKLNAELRISEKLNDIVGEWRIPVGTKASDSWGINGEAREEQFSDDVSTKDFKLGVSLKRDIGSWKRRYYLEFTRSITDIGYTNSVFRLAGASSVLAPGISLSSSTQDDLINTNRGASLFFDVHGAQEGLLSTVSFLQTHAIMRGALPLPLHFKFLGRLELGASVVKRRASLPLEQRFFAGGDDSIRGYGYRDIGIFDDDGNNTGGKFVSTASLEVERSIYRAYGAAAFWDMGGAGDTPAPALHHGVGLGFRYRAPFGSVRIDLAHPLDKGNPVIVPHIGVRVGL